MCARGLSLAGAVLLLIVCVNASQPLVLHKVHRGRGQGRKGEWSMLAFGTSLRCPREPTRCRSSMSSLSPCDQLKGDCRPRTLSRPAADRRASLPPQTPDPPLRRALQGYEDGVCDPARRDEDPDCGGGVPATACARFAGMAMAVRPACRPSRLRRCHCCGLRADAPAAAAPRLLQGGYQGYCMNDAGCMAIQLGQLDRDCAGVQASPPACSQACYATLSSVRRGGPGARWGRAACCLLHPGCCAP